VSSPADHATRRTPGRWRGQWRRSAQEDDAVLPRLSAHFRTRAEQYGSNSSSNPAATAPRCSPAAAQTPPRPHPISARSPWRR